MSKPRVRRGPGGRSTRCAPGALQRARRSVVAAVAAAMGLLCAADARAVPEPPRAAMRLEVVRGPGAEGCPGETALRAEVARELGADPFRDDAPRVLTVRIERNGVERMASLTLRDTDGETEWADAFGTRRPCEELLSGVALAIVAQLLSGPEGASPPPDPPAPPAAPRSQAPREALDPPRSAERSQAPSRPEAAPPPPERLQLEAGIGATLGLGITPGAAAGATLAVGVRRSGWSLAVEGRGLVSLAQEVKDVPLSSRAVTVAGVGCLRGRYLFGCGVAMVGGVRFLARDPWDLTSRDDALLGFGARLGSDWPLSERWSAHGYAEAAVLVVDAVLRRQGDPRKAPGSLTWSSPPLAAALGLGIAVRY